MKKRFIERFIPDAEVLKQHPMLQRLGRLQNSAIWHINRRSASRGSLIGMFFAFMPIPFRTIPVVLLCASSRANLPIAIGCTWIVNPLVMGPVFYGNYKMGAALLNIPLYDDNIVFSSEWLADRLTEIWLPLALGSLICATAAAAIAYTTVDLLWRRHTLRRWHNRRAASDK